MIRVLIADDYPVVRRGVKQIFTETTDIRLIDEANNGEEALDKARTTVYDVVLLDVSMPGRDGFDILKELKYECPDLPVLMLSMYGEEECGVRALRSGASGYITKESIPDEMVKAIRTVVDGRKYIGERLAEILAWHLNGPVDQPRHAVLSDRERQVMCLLGAGKRPKDIAAELSLSKTTISTYRTRILEKLNLKNSAEIMRYAIENQLLH